MKKEKISKIIDRVAAAVMVALGIWFFVSLNEIASNNKHPNPPPPSEYNLFEIIFN